MTNTHYPARQQGDNIIRKKLYYENYSEVQRVVQRLEDLGSFRHQGRRTVDEGGTYVLISYVDPTIVSVSAPSRSTDITPLPPARKLALPQRPAPVTKPLHRQWWFAPSVILAVLTMLCSAGYWAFQQLKQLSGPNVGVGLIGFAFVVVLVVWAVKNLRGGGSGGASGGKHGFHWTPCD